MLTTKNAESVDHRKRRDFMNNVLELINGDREEEYGTADESFSRIATLWTAYLGYPFNKKDVAMLLALLKVSRIASCPEHEDSWRDLAGYVALGGTLGD